MAVLALREVLPRLARCSASDKSSVGFGITFSGIDGDFENLPRRGDDAPAGRPGSHSIPYDGCIETNLPTEAVEEFGRARPSRIGERRFVLGESVAVEMVGSPGEPPISGFKKALRASRRFR